MWPRPRGRASSRRPPTPSSRRPCAGCPAARRRRPRCRPPRAGSAPGAGRRGPGARPRVLLADDNADMREYLHRLLRSSYQVTAVADGLTRAGRGTRQRAGPGHQRRHDAGLDGLALVAALRADPRTADVPVLLLSARAGQEAAIEGLEAGADDYLVKPFSAAELLARVRANVELARLRNHHARWRAALIDSLHEAFFLCDETGAVVEINAAFTDILGYGPEGLPYAAEHAWWPREDTEPEAHRQISEAFRQLMAQSKGSFVAPVTHKDGHRLWVAASFNEVQDPDTGRRMVVGTLRDITAEHYAGQREAALAAMGLLLSQASSVPQALQGAINELRRLWQARRVLAVTWDGGAGAVGDVDRSGDRAGRTCRRRCGNGSARCGVSPCSAPGGCRRRGPGDGAAGAARAGGRDHGRAPAGLAGRLDRRGRRPAVQRRGPRPAGAAVWLPGPGAAPGVPDRSAAGNGPRPAAGHPRAGPAARRFRGALRASQPPARGRRRLVRHRRAARRADRDRGRRLRRARPGRRDRDGPAPQRLPRPAPAGRERRPDAHRHGPVRRPHPRRHLQHGLLRHPRPGRRAG